MERGLSTHMVGRGIRWSDVLALLKHLGHESHFRRWQDPDAARRAEVLQVGNQLSGLIADRLEQLMFQNANALDKAPAQGTIDKLLGWNGEQSEDKPVRKKRRRRQLTAAEIREKVAQTVG